MKICPKCSATYKDEIRFCLTDGTPLVQQTGQPAASPVADYEEPETVISRNYNASEEPIVINFGQPEKASDPIMIDFSDVETVVHPPKQAEELPQVTVIEKPVAKTNNYVLFLVIGLFAGGGLVLLTLLLARSFFGGENVNSNNPAPVNQTVVTPNTNAAPNANQAIQNAAARHEKPNPSADVNVLNGKVIAVNAYVRALPNKDSAQIDVLPIGDRLEIKERENPASPWYQVVCEHGTVGWMHGNTIAFN